VSADGLVTVARVYRPAQLLVIQSLFQQAGILVCPTGYHHLTNQWEIALALGGIELRVPEVQADDARALLESLPPLSIPAYEISRSRFVRALVLVVLYCFACVPPPMLAAEIVSARRERPA
jgi:hypothetical protein